jgi:hypothetical protein
MRSVAPGHFQLGWSDIKKPALLSLVNGSPVFFVEGALAPSILCSLFKRSQALTCRIKTQRFDGRS